VDEPSAEPDIIRTIGGVALAPVGTGFLFTTFTTICSDIPISFSSFQLTHIPTTQNVFILDIGNIVGVQTSCYDKIVDMFFIKIFVQVDVYREIGFWRRKMRAFFIK
jgi:hypothetical protein